ncbi:hypothetical protein E3P86_02551 [Wallemia ichthyophaga]|uniref:WW domain-containing oxidoreductase n=2 Tax=Wallemia ichthyophaga TaxID=245174 RepID=A0A4T0J482_WALIC|nr:hypothetical protein E3P86_02551 [Wallemia ichthyophaga]
MNIQQSIAISITTMFSAFEKDSNKKINNINSNAFRGKTIICIGANAGIGLAMCDHVAQSGVKRLVMGCRSMDKGEAARSEIKERCPDLVVDLWQIDLSSLNSVRSFGQRWTEQAEDARTIDTLFLNAGLISPNTASSSSADGLEMTYACNVIGHLALISHLLPCLNSTDSRIIFTGSGAYMFTSLPSRPPPNKRTPLRDSWNVYGYVINAFAIYADSKLLLNVVVKELQQRLADKHIWVGVYHPGAVNTTITDKAHYGVSWLITYPFTYIMSYFGRTPAEGAAPGLHLASEPKENLPGGAYWNEYAQIELVKQAEDAELRKRYFDRCVEDARVDPAVFVA